MSEVKRYDVSAFGGMSMDESSDGAYVNYDDYAALEDKCVALAAENALLKGALNKIASTYQLSPHIRGMTTIQTPATDAFLAEIERKAIRKFINSIEHILRDKLSPYDTEEMLEAMRIFLEEQGAKQ